MSLDDTWYPRDLPILTEAARLLEAAEPGQGARLTDIAHAAGIDEDQTWKSLHALEDAGFIDVRWVHPARAGRVITLFREGREQVGLWPTAETALDRILEALDTIADNTDDPDTKTQAKGFRTWLKTSASTIGVGVAQAALTGQLPGQ